RGSRFLQKTQSGRIVLTFERVTSPSPRTVASREGLFWTISKSAGLKRYKRPGLRPRQRISRRRDAFSLSPDRRARTGQSGPEPDLLQSDWTQCFRGGEVRPAALGLGLSRNALAFSPPNQTERRHARPTSPLPRDTGLLI